MLWLCLHFPRLPAEALGLRDPLEVITEQRGARRWLITAAPSLAVGTPLATALALQPALRAHPRRPATERAALQSLAHAVYRYGSPVCAEIRESDAPGRAPLALLWVEIAASLQLFGGLDALRNAVSRDLAELEYSAQLAIAPTRAAAALFAALAQPGVRSAGRLEAALAAVPVEVLPWPAAALELLHGVGLKTLGELFALPRSAFARRFGPHTLRELDQLRGRSAEPAPAIVPPARFRRRFELLGEVETIEALSFALKRLTLELQHWLRARDLGVRAVRLDCEHAQRRRSSCTLRYSDAHRDARRLFDTLRERLERQPLVAAVRALQLEAVELGSAEIVQHDLFDASEAGASWRATLERIGARLGDRAVWTPQLGADHRPERAAWQAPAATASPASGAASGARPLWLLDTPRPIAPPSPATPPERIESGWWDQRDVRRDYHWLETARGRHWVFRDHHSGQWFLHGLDG